MAEEYAYINVISGYSQPVNINYPDLFIVDALATHWASGGMRLERSALGKEAYSTVQDEDGDVNFTSNGSRIVPGVGSYRVFCSGYENMSGVELLFSKMRTR